MDITPIFRLAVVAAVITTPVIVVVVVVILRLRMFPMADLKPLTIPTVPNAAATAASANEEVRN